MPAGSPAGHCPRCLVKLTFNSEDPEEETAWKALSGCELYEEIGRGGMGVVYRAKQRGLNRIVAVKVLLRAQFVGGEERERFHREAQAAARLKHPGIVGIYEVGEEDGVPWFSMEHIPGQNLERVVREHPMAAKEAARCVKEVAEAIQHAHEHGVLHRDLKPSNILLDEAGVPRITDFGIARMASSGTTNHKAAELTRTGQMLGSPGYAAPEQALSGHADVRTDVYGLGALLYHLLTGCPPFQGPTLDAILVQLRESEPLSPRRLNPSVPRDLETICLKCLHKQPEGRYTSASALAEDLCRFLEDRPILARPLSPWGKTWRWVRGHPGIAAMVVVIALLLVAIVGGSLAFAWQQARMEHRSSLLSEARSLRQLRLAGSRNDALLALRKAWEIAPSSEIRNEVIACLALEDIVPLQRIAPGKLAAKAPDPTLSADGSRRARFDGDEVIVIEQVTGKEIARHSGHKAGSLMKLDDRGTRLAIVAPQSGVLKIISVSEGRVLTTCEHPVALTSVDWSGDLIATGCENRFIYIWDDQGRMKHRLSGHQGVPVHVSFRPRSQYLCSTARDVYVRLWHAARGEEIVRREVEHYPHTALWWSADGARLHASTEDGGADVFAIQKSPCLELLTPPQEEPHTENLGTADVSADGELAIVVDEESARLWDFRTGRLVTVFPKPPAQWLSAKFARQAKRLWICGWSHALTGHDFQRDAQGFLQLQGATKPMFGHGNLLRDLNADGSQFVLSHNGLGEFIIAWPATQKMLRLKHPGNLATAISPDGTWLVTTSYQKPGARIWSATEGKLQRTLCKADTVMQTLITPDGQRLIMQTSGGNRVFRTRDWSEENALPAKLRLTCMAVSPDSKYLATIGDSDVRLLHADSFTEVFRLILPAHVGWLGEAHLVFDGDGSHLLIHTALGSVVRWDLRAMKAELAKLGM